MVKIKSVPLTRARHAINFGLALESKGIQAENWLKRSRLPVDLLEKRNDDCVVSALCMLDFAETAAADTCIHDLGYWAGTEPIKSYGDFGAHVVQAFSLYDAIQTFCSKVRGECSEADYYLVYNETKAWFCHGPSADCMLQRQHELYALMIMMQVIRLALGTDWRPAQLRLQQKNETKLADNDFLAGSNIEFGAATTGIEIPLQKLATKIKGPVGNLRIRSGSRPDSYSAFFPSFPSDPLTALQALISNHIQQSKKPSIEIAAEFAGVSPRTLQRYLRSKATSYSKLLDQVRFDMAMPMLNDQSATISEIAYQLGYSNIAHFSRAFTRIAGMSPRAYRGMLNK